MNNDQSNVWGKLVSVNPNLQNVNLTNKAYKIGRNSNNDIAIVDVRISGTHCIITQGENGTVILQDLSSNGTFIGEQKVGKGKSKLLSSGDKFYLLPVTKVSEKELLGYIFTFNNPEQNPLKRVREEEFERALSNKQIKKPEKMEEEEETISRPECSLCPDVIYQCVTTVPCQHNFCGACFSESAGNLPTCPICFTDLKELKRNEGVDQQANLYLEKNPRSKPSVEELRRKNNANKYKNGIIFPKSPERGRQRQEAEQKEQRNNLGNGALINGNRKTEMAIETPLTGEALKQQRYYQLMSKFTAE